MRVMQLCGDGDPRPWFSFVVPFCQICVDVFVCGTAYVDVATLSGLCNCTGGQLRILNGFVKLGMQSDTGLSDRDATLLREDAGRSLQSQVCADAFTFPSRPCAVPVVANHP